MFVKNCEEFSENLPGMPQEFGEPNICYDSNSNSSDDCPEKVSGLSARHIAAAPNRRRTYSENAVIDEPIQVRPMHEAHLRRRAKSGDDGRRERVNSPHNKQVRSRSGNLVWGSHHHYAEDRKPLLPIESLKEKIVQVANRCTACNFTHSDDSSCDTSCSSHGPSCEKICQTNGNPGQITSRNENDDKTDLDHLNQYSHVNKMDSVVCNGGLEMYDPNQQLHHRHGKDYPLPTILYSNDHGPNGQIEPAAHMLLEEEPSKAGQASSFARKQTSKCRAYFGLLILLLANTLNYMDRYTIAGVLLDVKSFYGIQNNQVGLLQTSFIISYMVFSPIFGYMGDRYSRKLIMAVGIFFWSVITLGSSFIDADKFSLFLFMRALVGIGEASYSTIAPTIIADLYVGTQRTKALAVFYFAIPVGSGLGYIAGSKFAEALGNWQWALRITPGFGILCVILILLVVKEPQRGAAEGNIHLNSSTWSQDLIYLFKHKSFMLSSAGFTCVAFIAGALALWTPTYMYYSIRQKPQPADESTVSMIFGVITCASGFVGVGAGSWAASRLRVKMGSKADPIVCAFGLISCSPFLFLALYLSRQATEATWALIFLGETLLALNWALVTDILLYIVVPNRRATAEAVQILMSHAFGDAGSPYLVGQLADSIADMDGFPQDRAGQYISLQYAMYICCFVAVIGGGFFLLTSMYIQKDKNTAQADVNVAVASKVGADGTVEPVSPVVTDEPDPVVT